MGVHVLEYTRKVGLRLKLNKESKLGIKKANFEMRDICCQLSTKTKITKKILWRKTKTVAASKFESVKISNL